MKKPKNKLVADLHVHTVASGHAYSTLQEYVTQAKKIGLKAIAITDHGPAMPGGAPMYHFSNLRMVPGEMDGVRIYRGAECNIIDQSGRLDLPDEVLDTLDIVMIAMHPRVGYESMGEDVNTDVLIKAMSNPYVNVVAHPGNPMYPVSIEETVAAAKKHGVAIEINNSSFTGSRNGSWERCLEFAKKVKDENHFVVIGTDSHITTMLGAFQKAVELIEASGLTEKNIINTSLEKIDKCLIRAK